MEDPLIFSLSALVLLIAPGPTNTLLAMSGAAIGFRRSTPLLMGAVAGYTLSILAIHLIFERLVVDLADATAALRIVASAYLLALAIRLWVHPAPTKECLSISPLQVFITTLLNPKTLVFALVIVPLQAPLGLLYLIAFSGIVIVLGAIWVFAGTAFGRTAPVRYLALLPRVASVSLAVFALGLIASQFLRLESGWV